MKGRSHPQPLCFSLPETFGHLGQLRLFNRTQRSPYAVLRQPLSWRRIVPHRFFFTNTRLTGYTAKRS
jgi:hypothetical protein